MAQERKRLPTCDRLAAYKADFVGCGQKNHHHHHRRQQRIDAGNLHKPLSHVAIAKETRQFKHGRSGNDAADHSRHQSDTCHGASLLTVVR